MASRRPRSSARGSRARSIRDSLTASSVTRDPGADRQRHQGDGRRVARRWCIGTDPAIADFSVGLAADAGVGNTILEIRPLKPLVPSTGSTNNGYLVLLTDGIETLAGAPRRRRRLRQHQGRPAELRDDHEYFDERHLPAHGRAPADRAGAGYRSRHGGALVQFLDAGHARHDGRARRIRR